MGAERITLIAVRRCSTTDGRVVPSLYGIEQTHNLTMREQLTDLIF